MLTADDIRTKMMAAIGIAERLLRARQSANLSQDGASKALNVSRAAISQWETGSTTPGIRRLEEAAVAYGVSPEWLITGDTRHLFPTDVEVEKVNLQRELATIKKRMVPFLSKDQIAEYGATTTEYRAKMLKNFVIDSRILSIDFGEGYGIDVDDCFAMEVEDDSMKPVIRKRDVVVVWALRTTPIWPGWTVLIVPNKEIGPIFRKVRPVSTRVDGSFAECELLASNPDWPTLRVPEYRRSMVVGLPVEVRRLLPIS